MEVKVEIYDIAVNENIIYYGEFSDGRILYIKIYYKNTVCTRILDKNSDLSKDVVILS